MKCYYEVLEVSREADSGEIKSSYRKLALRWHPDKNLSNSEEAKEQFQLVQNAYEVLSDPQERAWYDTHREQLLKGAGTSYNDETLDLIPYFTASCYKGFGDDDSSFYNVYNEIFKKLASEEVEYLEDPEDVSKIPLFGTSSTEYEKVEEFYSYWMSFSTLKSYVWLDKYDIREADNRKILKLLEKENQKIRQKARKERNEEIRQLVSFVKKRDKRVLVYMKLREEQAKENKKKLESMRREKIIQRQNELEEAKKKLEDVGVYTMTNFNEQLEEIEKHLADEFGHSDDDYYSDSDEDQQNTDDKIKNMKSNIAEKEIINGHQASMKNLYCVACNKLFKNVKSFENHENSKKHRENVLNLKVSVELDTSENEDNSIIEEENLSEDCDDVSDIIIEDCKNKAEKKKKNKKQLNILDDHNEEMLDVDIDSLNSGRCRRARRDKFLENTVPQMDDGSVLCNINQNNHPLNETSNANDTSESHTISKNAESTESADHTKTKKRGKDKKSAQSKKNTVITVDIDNIDISQCCAICKSTFASKNKLFDHLKKTGHQVYIPNSENLNEKKSKRKKKS